MKKIKFSAGWDTSEQVTKRLLSQFKTPDIDLSEIEFVYDDSYDVIVFNNYITEQPKTGSRACVFFHEPSWSGSHQKDYKNYENFTVFGHYKELYNAKNIVEIPSHLFYGGRGPWCEGWDFWSYDNISNSKFEKTKGMSSVVSNLGINGDNYPQGCLYKERCNLITKLSDDLPFIDFYGWGQNDTNLKGSVHQKKDGIVDYKFSICLENTNEKNYISEKFYDCILTNTIPIYFGCKNVKDIWPENGYINIDDINDIPSIVSQLKNINDNLDFYYDSMLPELLKMKKRYFSEFNLLKKIDNFTKCKI
jgi:hypothetical protein